MSVSQERAPKPSLNKIRRNQPFSSSAAPSPVSPKAATVIPVSMDKPSFQISDGSIKADESICEKQRMIL